MVKCNHCDKSFSTTNDMKMHIRSQHEKMTFDLLQQKCENLAYMISKQKSKIHKDLYTLKEREVRENSRY